MTYAGHRYLAPHLFLYPDVNPRPHGFVFWGARIAAAIPIAVGCVWLTWAFNGRSAEWARAGVISVKTNMALAQVLAGAALALLAWPSSSRQRWIGLLLASAVLLIGGLTLSQYVVGWDLGID